MRFVPHRHPTHLPLPRMTIAPKPTALFAPTGQNPYSQGQRPWIGLGAGSALKGRNTSIPNTISGSAGASPSRSGVGRRVDKLSASTAIPQSRVRASTARLAIPRLHPGGPWGGKATRIHLPLPVRRRVDKPRASTIIPQSRVRASTAIPHPPSPSPPPPGGCARRFPLQSLPRTWDMEQDRPGTAETGHRRRRRASTPGVHLGHPRHPRRPRRPRHPHLSARPARPARPARRRRQPARAIGESTPCRWDTALGPRRNKATATA